jgi:hypothetical protein
MASRNSARLLSKTQKLYRRLKLKAPSAPQQLIRKSINQALQKGPKLKAISTNGIYNILYCLPGGGGRRPVDPPSSVSTDAASLSLSVERGLETNAGLSASISLAVRGVRIRYINAFKVYENHVSEALATRAIPVRSGVGAILLLLQGPCPAALSKSLRVIIPTTRPVSDVTQRCLKDKATNILCNEVADVVGLTVSIPISIKGARFT